MHFKVIIYAHFTLTRLFDDQKKTVEFLANVSKFLEGVIFLIHILRHQAVTYASFRRGKLAHKK
jgi:hypothetical protein